MVSETIIMTCHYCLTPTTNKICPLCTDIKGSLSLRDFDSHAFLAYRAGEYTEEQYKHINKVVREQINEGRLKSAKKMVATKTANSTGWHKFYAELCLKATGSLPTSFPMATDTNDITNAIIDIIKWSKGWAIRTGNEGRMLPDGMGGWKRIHGANNGITDITASHPMIGALAIEIKNKFTKDTWKELDKYGKKTAQAKYRDAVVAGGAIHYIATDIESFIVWWVGLFEGGKLQLT